MQSEHLIIDVDLHVAVQDVRWISRCHPGFVPCWFLHAFFDAHEGGHSSVCSWCFLVAEIRTKLHPLRVKMHPYSLSLPKSIMAVLLGYAFVKLGDIDPKGFGDLDVRLQGAYHFFIFNIITSYNERRLLPKVSLGISFRSCGMACSFSPIYICDPFVEYDEN